MSTHTTPKPPAERNRDYRARLAAANKYPLRLVVHEHVARQLHDLVRARVESPADVLVKALAALQAAEALVAGATETAS